MPARTLPNLSLLAGYDLGEDGWADDMTLNLLKLSVLTQGTVQEKVAAEPVSPTAGDVILLDETNATNPNAVAVYDGPTGEEAWVYIAPNDGWLLYNQAAGYYEKFDGTVWAELETGGGGGGAGGDGRGVAARGGAGGGQGARGARHPDRPHQAAVPLRRRISVRLDEGQVPL